MAPMKCRVSMRDLESMLSSERLSCEECGGRNAVACAGITLRVWESWKKV